MLKRYFHFIFLLLFLVVLGLTFAQTPDSAKDREISGQAKVPTPDDNELKYRIILAVGKNNGRWAWIRDLRERVNGITASGYRLKSLVLPMALVAKDPGGYQYDFLDENSSGMNLLGFRLFAHYLLGTECRDLGVTENEHNLYCLDITTDAYERPIDATGKIEQYIVDLNSAPISHPAHFMAAEINQKFREGFYPAKIISKYGIVLEKSPEPEHARFNPEFEVLREGSKLERKANLLAKQGYRVLMTESGIAVLYRNDKTRGVPVTYHWVDGIKSDVGEKVAKLEQAGARYLSVSSNEKGIRKFLIFEQPAQAPSKPSQFKILDLATEMKTDPVDGQNYLDLTDDAKRSVEEMNRLANEGFVVHDLFQGEKVAVLLERTQ